MKKLLSLFFTFLIVEGMAIEHSLELRADAFFPSSSLFRNIYGNAQADYELEYALRGKLPLGIWANLAWLPKHGHSVGLGSTTQINLLNLSAGIRGYYDFNSWVSAYIGLGPSLTEVWIKNQGYCDYNHTNRLTVGGIAKVGFYITLYKAFFADVFADYLYLPVTFKEQVNLGGLKVGLGLGFRI